MSSSIHSYFHPKLRRSLQIYLAISVVLLGVLLFNLIKGRISLKNILLGLAVGVVAGFFFSRMRKISWDQDSGLVTISMDWVAVLFLIVYSIFELNRERLASLFVHGPEAAVVSLAILAGIFYGRVLGGYRAAARVLQGRGV